jgi:hypothetical protein
MTPFSILPSSRKRSTTRLAVQSLEDRATPATAVYTPLSQTLTVVAAEGDQIEVAADAGQPTGYLQVTETQTAVTVFDSISAGQAVRNLVVKYGNVQSGGFMLDAGVKIGGSLTINGATSSQTVDLAGTVGGNVIYSANMFATFDVVNFESSAMVGGNMTLAMKNGTNTVRLKGGMIDGSLAVTGGAGDDTVEVTESGDVTINGSASFNLGNGNNSFIGEGPVGIASTVRVGSSFTYIGGTGNDTFDLDISGTALNVGTDAKFTLGTPTVFDGNTVKFEALRAGRNIVFAGGMGDDTVISTGAFTAKGNVNFNLGAGDNSFDSNLQGIGTNAIAGNFTYTGGPNGDLVNLDAMTIGKNLTVALGESNGATQGLSVGLKNPAGVTVFGAVKVTGGSGVDGVILRRLYVGSSLTVKTGAGEDTVAFDDLNVAGATLIDLGAGNDQLQGEMMTSDGSGALANPTTFGGAVSIKGGDGNDSVNLSSDGDTTTLIKFGSRASFQGGNGADTLQNAAENVYNVIGNFDDFDVKVGAAVI